MICHVPFYYFSRKFKTMGNKLILSLKENGIHSLEKGLKTFAEFEKKIDTNTLLKESIMFLHNGIELLMKQILVEKTSEHLIYSDIDDAAKKIIKAQKDNYNAFFPPNGRPIHTVGYELLLERIHAFVETPKISESLKTFLSQLGGLRNQIEHYAIDEEEDTIKELISKIKNPLLKFFQEGLKDFNENDFKEITKEWGEVTKHINAEKKILSSVGKAKTIDKAMIIICEGRNDIEILRLFSEKILQKYKLQRNIHIIAAGGVFQYERTLKGVVQQNQKIIVVVDGDGVSLEREKHLNLIGVKPENQIIIEPFIEKWLLTYGFEIKNKTIRDIKIQLFSKGKTIQQIIDPIDIDKLKKREKSFEKFISVLIDQN